MNNEPARSPALSIGRHPLPAVVAPPARCSSRPPAWRYPSSRALPGDRRGRPSPCLCKPRMIGTARAPSNGWQGPQGVDGISNRPPPVCIWFTVRPSSAERRRAGLTVWDEFPCPPGAMGAVLPKLAALLRLEEGDSGCISREQEEEDKVGITFLGSLEVAAQEDRRVAMWFGPATACVSGLPKPVSRLAISLPGSSRAHQASFA